MTKTEYRRKWYREHRAQEIARSVAWRQKNPQRAKEIDHKWAQGHPDKKKANSFRQGLARYGITPEQYDAMLAAQGGHCAICPATEPGGRGRWHVDHDHETGKVRGLLCHDHNLMLGHAKDRVEILESAISYLRRTR